MVVSHRPPAASARASITREEALVLYRDLQLGRQFEDKCAEMYYKGKMFGFVHLYTGQEAVTTGVIKALVPTDYVAGTYREHVHALSAGVSARSIMAELFGKATGCSKGRGGSMHLFDASHNFLGGYAFVAEGIPVATGTAFAAKYRWTYPDLFPETSTRAMDVTTCFFGDGACNNGQFFECLNMAALWKLPVIYVVENNNWAIGMQHERATSDVEIYKKAQAFGMHGERVDGMDVLAVRKAAQDAIARARAGEGPTLLECMTYRFRGHSLADPDELRDPAEKEFWRQRDPIPQFERFVIEQGLLSEAECKAIADEIKAEVEDAVEFGLTSPEPTVDELYRYIYAEDE